MSGAEKRHCSSVVRSSQFTVRDVGREGSEVSREGVELRSFRGSWSRLRSMLSEPDASRSGNSGLVSSAKRRYLKHVHRKIPVSGHQSRTREHELVHYTHSQLWDVVRRSRGPFTHLCRAERGRKRAKVTLSPAFFHRAPLPFWSERKGGFGLPLLLELPPPLSSHGSFLFGPKPNLARARVCVASGPL